LSALPPVYVKSIDGKKVRTNQKMVLFMGWFEKQASADVINASRAGAVIAGMKHEKDDAIDFPEHDDIQKTIDALYESSRIEHARVDSMISDLAGRISDMTSSAVELRKKLDQGVVLAEELCTLMRSDPGNGGRIRYILGKLGDIDEYLHAATGAKDMISLTVQRVIHTVTEGYDPGDEAISDQHAVALRSRFLYKGLRDGCIFSLKYLDKMKRMLA